MTRCLLPPYWLPKPLLAMVVALSISGAVMAGSPIAPADSLNGHSAESLARRALAAHKDESASAIAELRSMGPEGLRGFLEANRAEIQAAIGTPDDSGERLRSAGDNQVLSTLDSICQQKDCYASKLYWYTDIEQAKAAARKQSKPILSLRLLGRLDEDLSCANSRLFRITLYANEQVSKLLRETFVLHWESVRPVPKLTIDFGDGRKMERTLTGNSIHYVLDSEGRVIDALPGLYGPGAFVRELQRISSAAAMMSSLATGEDRNLALRRYHETRLSELENGWLNDVKRAGLRAAPSREIPKPSGPTPPSAERAAAIGLSKSVVIERPILRGMSDDPKLLDSIGADAGWSKIARLHAADASLDQATRELMAFKDPSVTRGSLQYATIVLSGTIAEDTVRNEYVFRARIHQWLASGTESSDVAALNERIYAELFLTPNWDAWLGLRPASAYSGIDNDGVRK